VSAAFSLVRRVVAITLAAGASAGLAACGGASSKPSASGTITMIGGSELKDMLPILADAEKATGVHVDLSYTGSLDGADKIASGTDADAAWFASDKYIALAGASTKVLERKNIMLSPVIIGVKHSVARRLGWTNGTVTWSQITAAAGARKFRFAMTSPTASNSGFSALVSVADALANGQALTASTFDADGLRRFFNGQALTSGSSGFLVDAYTKSQDNLDGIVNYESVLVGLNSSGQLADPLDLIYPTEGIVTADYPLMLLDSAKRPGFDKLTAYLTQRAVQLKIQRTTARRAVTPGVTPDPRLAKNVLIEATFPANLDVVQRLLDDYQSKLRRPASTIYVLDVSGSMKGSRLDSLKQAMTGLAGLDSSFSGHFTRFNPREKVTLVVFDNVVEDTQSFTIDSSDPASSSLTSFRTYIDALQAGGGTAIYSALERAYSVAARARQTDPSSYASIVLMTDGENNAGISAEQFLDGVAGLPSGVRTTRVFTVLFGEASSDDLGRVADATGGKVFDARSAPLAEVFKEIRGYQ
jgi:Ca-activated chloride channel homolog